MTKILNTSNTNGTVNINLSKETTTLKIAQVHFNLYL